MILSAWAFIPERRARAIFRTLIRDRNFGKPDVFFEILLGTIVLLGAMVLYSVWTYPYIIRSIGGGYQPIIELVFPGPSSIPWKSESIATSLDGKLVGLVRLVLETDSELYVASESASDKRATIAVRRDSLSAILYSWKSGTRPYLLQRSPSIQSSAAFQELRPSATPSPSKK